MTPVPDDEPYADRIIEAYGLRIASRFPFSFHVPIRHGPFDLTFEVVEALPLPPGWDRAPARFDQRTAAVGGDMVSAVFEVDGALVARFGSFADYHIGGKTIACHVRDPRYAFAVEIWLFGTVLALWLERHGLVALHAAAVAFDEGAAAFLATNEGGKTTLAIALLRAGGHMLTDDVLALESVRGEVLARPGYPQVRLWPDHARALLGTIDGLERVQPGSPKLRVPVAPSTLGEFRETSAPLRVVYLPEREARRDVSIEDVPLAEALTQLVRHSFLVGVTDALGMTGRRFGALSDLLQKAPLRRLRYPSGLDRLPAVAQAIRSDLASIVSNSDPGLT